MSRRTNRLGRLSAGTAGIALGLLPATAAMALEKGDAGTPAFAATCATSAAEPMSMPLSPQREVTKNAPYSGVGVTEVVTTLADGNRITRTNTMRYFRDSAGRTRTEYQLAAIGPFVPEEAQTVVTITDPVAGKHYVLHPEMRRADEFKLAAGGTPGPAAGAIMVGSAFTSVNGTTRSVSGVGVGVPAPALTQSNEKGGRIRMEGSRTRGGDRTPTMMGPAVTFSGAAGSGTGAGMRTQIGPAGAPPPPPPHFDMLVVNNGTPVCKGGPKKSEPVSIGERRIEGLKVTGSRLEFTIEAGAVGNEQPITVRTDQWFSPDLGVVVSSTHHDPMIGDTTYRLEQINRAEPNESLFVVPSDYAKNSMGF